MACAAAGWRLSQFRTSEKSGPVAVSSGSVTAPAQATTKEASAPEPAEKEPAPGDNPRVVKWVFSAAAGVEMARNEVTLDAYKMCYHAGACSLDGVDSVVYKRGGAHYQGSCHWNDYQPDHADIFDRMNPMNCVSVSDAEAFCDWVGGRLPTYAEWVAEATNGGQRAYPWGNEKPSCERAVVLDDPMEPGCGKHWWKVCSKPLGNSASGLCDMIGNVSEYVSKDGGYFEVGGSDVKGFEELESANLLRGSAVGSDQRDDRFGFRCVRNPVPR